jgi:hypothetical protein
VIAELTPVSAAGVVEEGPPEHAAKRAAVAIVPIAQGSERIAK